jgi:hypothetical protein
MRFCRTFPKPPRLRGDFFWHASCYCSRRKKTDVSEWEDVVVNAIVDFPDASYAVIEGLQTETGRENIVIAYPNEKTLRETFAASSIVAFGFATRDEAIEAVADPPTTETMTTEISKPSRRPNWGEPRKEKDSILRRLGRFHVISWSDLVTSAVVMLASTNTISSAIRMALGSSV